MIAGAMQLYLNDAVEAWQRKKSRTESGINLTATAETQPQGPLDDPPLPSEQISIADNIAS